MRAGAPERPAHRGSHRGRRPRSRLIALSIAAAAVLGVALIVGALTTMSGGSSRASAEIEIGPGVVLPRSTVQKMHAVADIGSRFTVPSVGLDVPLGQLTMADDTITPPGIGSVYLVRNLGVPLSRAEDGTVFVATHSCRVSCHAPGDWLVDRAKGTASVTAGALIEVGARTYRVTGSEKVAKSAIGRDAAIWASKPGRLVVITCLQLASNQPPVDNLVITAQLVDETTSTSKTRA